MPSQQGSELRLADGGTVSVSEEQHYQEVLVRCRGHEREREVVAVLTIAEEGNPWSRKPTGPALEVVVEGLTVGFLTAAMTTRYRPFAEAAAAAGRTLTAKATIGPGSGSNGRDVEIVLNVVPRPVEQRNIEGLAVTTTADYVLTPRSGFAHVIKSEMGAGWLVECGEELSQPAAVLIFSTKPWVGRVDADGVIVDEWPRWCETCRPDHVDVLDGGRFGEYTSINRNRRFSSAMTAIAVGEALADRLDFDVAGESFRPGYPDTLLRFAEILRASRPGERLAVVLRRDPANSYDANAIEVHIPGEVGHVGFVPGVLARHLAPVLDAGEQIRASAVEVRIHQDAPDKPGLTVTLRRARTA